MTRPRKPTLSPGQVSRAVDAFAPAPVTATEAKAAELELEARATEQRARVQEALYAGTVATMQANLPQVIAGQGDKLRRAIFANGRTINAMAAHWRVNPRAVRGWIEEREAVPAWVWERLKTDELQARAPYPWCPRPVDCIAAHRCLAAWNCGD